MAQFESSVKYVPYSQEQVFNKLSDLSNLESVRDKLADKVQGMEFDCDSLSFTVQGISITLRIIEREPCKCVKFESEKSPVVDSDFACRGWAGKTESNYSCRSEYVYEGNGY